MDDLFCPKDLFDLIKLGFNKTTQICEDDWEKLHRKVVENIKQLIKFSVYPHIKHIKHKIDALVLGK